MILNYNNSGLPIKGRIIVFGEYIFDLQPGLCHPTADSMAILYSQKNVNYDLNCDQLPRILKSLRYNVISKSVESTVPYGHGLASSSCLCLLHLRDIEPNIQNIINVANSSDEKIHGFRPSGVDIHSVAAGHSGIYSVDIGWTDVDLCIPEFQCIIPPKEGRFTLKEIAQHIRSQKIYKDNCDNLMAHYSNSGRFIESDLFIQHCWYLCGLGIYSQWSKELISKLLSHNIPAKCTGGLYDKAIIAYTNKSDLLSGLGLKHHSLGNYWTI